MNATQALAYLSGVTPADVMPMVEAIVTGALQHDATRGYLRDPATEEPIAEIYIDCPAPGVIKVLQEPERTQVLFTLTIDFPEA